MRRIKRLATISLLALVIIAGIASRAGAATAVSPNDPTSGELVNHPKQWDGTEITFEGEAISQAMYRGDWAWVHVNDDAYYLKNVEEGSGLGGYNSGHAVWMPRELADKVDIFGDYSHEGDVVRVRGTFNAACGEHGGDMDIHATTLEIVLPGHRFSEVVHPVKAGVAALLAVIALGLWFAQRRVKHLDAFGLLKPHRR